MKNILILGASGMLGSMVLNVFRKETNYSITASLRKINKHKAESGFKWAEFDAAKNIKFQLQQITTDFVPDYIINCIGIIKPYCKDDDQAGRKLATKVNALFPMEMAEYFVTNHPDSKIIQIATDCVYQGDKGYYDEDHPHDAIDVYGKSKSLGEVILDNTINIRCSIIGPEIKNKLSLLEWFLSREKGEKIYGFDHHLWNGVTTLQFARLCKNMIENYAPIQSIGIIHVLHYIINEDVSKYELLEIFKKIFQTDIKIEKTSTIGPSINRTLRTKYRKNNLMSMEQAVFELKEYMQYHFNTDFLKWAK